jgi:glycosyltransferase involved in cell wall biosynthesis
VVTDFAASFCKKIFCTSRFSYTAKYRKTVLMPVGVDTDLFTVDAPTGRRLLDILSLGRISPSKHLDFLVSAINKINDPNIRVSIYGDPLPLDQVYYEELKKKAGSLIRFQQGIVNAEAPRIYGSHNIFVNLSSSGMYDKTIFEAMASGCLVLVSNDNLIGHIGSDFIFKQGDMDEFIHKLQKLLAYSEDEKLVAQRDLVRFAYTHSLGRLGDRLFQEII